MSIAEVRFSELASRLDADYYRPEFVENEALLPRLASSPLAQVADLATDRVDPAASPADEFGYIDITNVDVIDGSVTLQRMRGWQASSRARKRVAEGDVLVSTVRPNRSAIALIDASLAGAVGSTGFAVVRPRAIDPAFLFAYLKTRFARLQLVRRTSATLYPAVAEASVLRLLVPPVADAVRRGIASSIRAAIRARGEARDAYDKALGALYAKLGRPRRTATEVAYEVPFSSLGETLDAPDHHPLYVETLDLLHSSGSPVVPLSEAARWRRETFRPETEPATAYDVVELEDVSQEDGTLRRVRHLRGWEVGGPRVRFRAGDILLSRLRFYLREIALVPRDASGGLCSPEFYALEPKLDPHYLLAYLRSDFGYNQMRFKSEGSTRPRYPRNKAANLQVAVPEPEVQREIGDAMRRAHEARYRSRRLVQEAVRHLEHHIASLSP